MLNKTYLSTSVESMEFFSCQNFNLNSWKYISFHSFPLLNHVSIVKCPLFLTDSLNQPQHPLGVSNWPLLKSLKLELTKTSFQDGLVPFLSHFSLRKLTLSRL